MPKKTKIEPCNIRGLRDVRHDEGSNGCSFQDDGGVQAGEVRYTVYFVPVLALARIFFYCNYSIEIFLGIKLTEVSIGMSSRPLKTENRYSITETVAKGRNSIIYSAQDSVLGRRVAIKCPNRGS
jgi:hypothetical protein